MKQRILATAGLAAAALVWTGACASSKPDPTALAIIESRSGSGVTGKVIFTQLPSGQTKAEVWIQNATPGMHGLHIHDKGDCSAPDANSAGGHFNPSGNPHAAPTEKAHHNGDFGNIEIGADSKGHTVITSDMLTVTPGPNSVVGKSVIFHEKADDLTTQPTGNSGARFGCGVIVETPTGNASEIRVR
jgi:superoxide dismutase, Cu-Zn family